MSKLNKQKCRFSLLEIPFLGHVVSKDGLKPDPEKIRAVLEMESPKDKAAVERLKGTVTYLARFVPNLTAVIRPIAQLTHQGEEWHWNDAQKNAFVKLKQLLTEAPVLAYFDQNKPLTIQCDASKNGLGAALLQDNRPIAYASRALTDVETRYAIIEKEMLAIVFSLEKWHQYTYGRKVAIQSDHKPLEAITRKPLDRAPKRLQAMLLRALAYDIEVNYLPGKKMLIADTLSRTYLAREATSSECEFETINALSYLPMKEDIIQKIQTETAKDDALQNLKGVIQRGWSVEKSELHQEVTPYFPMRDELAVTDGLIFKGERLVVPKSLRNEMKNNIHLGHSGIEGCLRRARESVYWPGMNAEIKIWIQSCETCRTYETSNMKETLMSHDLPERKWQKVGIDLMHCNDKDYLITCHACSDRGISFSLAEIPQGR